MGAEWTSVQAAGLIVTAIAQLMTLLLRWTPLLSHYVLNKRCYCELNKFRCLVICRLTTSSFGCNTNSYWAWAACLVQSCPTAKSGQNDWCDSKGTATCATDETYVVAYGLRDNSKLVQFCLMPKILSKAKWEHGSGDVLNYERDPSSFYLRCRISGTDRYQSSVIPGATSLEQAQQAACAVYAELIQPRLSVDGSGSGFSINVTTTKNSKSHSKPVEWAIDRYLENECEKWETGQISRDYYLGRVVHINIHLKQYLASQGVKQTREIKPTTFDHYIKFRQRTAKSKLTLNQELKSIKHFFRNYLLKHRLIEPDLLLQPNLFPLQPVFQSDLTANPAINEDDWRLFTDEIHRYVKAGEKFSNWRVAYYRHLFWSFCLVMKNTGIRPCELFRLKWKHMEFETEEKPDGSLREIAHIALPAPITKTKIAREVPTAGGGGDRLVAWLKYQMEFCEKRGFRKPGMNDLVFALPHLDWKAPERVHFNRTWGNIRLNISHLLQGHKFSDKPYTLYSMRSTFVEDRLLDDVDAWLVARWAGHSVDVLMRHYERMNVRKRSEEATRINYGEKKQEKATRTMSQLIR